MLASWRRGKSFGALFLVYAHRCCTAAISLPVERIDIAARLRALVGMLHKTFIADIVISDLHDH